jgi:alpha-tubulin suppressor-like RCC1 family protein
MAPRPATVPPADSGPVYAWGNGIDGEIGNGSTPAAQAFPTTVPLPSGVTAVEVAGGAETSYALGSDGNVYAWGNGTDGELGNDGTTPLQDSAVQVDLKALKGVAPVAIAAGTDRAYSLDADGNVWAFGNDGNGELGDGGAGGEELSPVEVDLDGDTIVAIAAGSITGYALDQSGYVWSWGYGADGELGDGSSGSTESSETAAPPTLVIDPDTGGLFQASAIAAGGSNAYAIGLDGDLYAWGDNTYGQLGNGSSDPNSSLPALVELPDDDSAVSIAAGARTAYALDASGDAFSWGYGMDGELGDGAAVNSPTPVPVTMPAGVSFLEITGSYTNGYAIGSNQDVYTWGYDGEGELGNGSVDPGAYGIPEPAAISGINPGDPPLALGPEAMSDTALLIGEGAPTVVVSEAPLPVLLPLVALFAIAAVVFVRRRHPRAA